MSLDVPAPGWDREAGRVPDGQPGQLRSPLELLKDVGKRRVDQRTGPDPG